MKVFISWSGERSHAVATALSVWMRDIFSDVEPWMSAHDISAGARWGHELSSVLENSHFGVLCLTPENIESPWLLFEAGALSKAATIARVVPYIFGLSLTSIRFPLAQFQATHADRPGTMQLLESINQVRQVPMSGERLRGLFSKWWPELEATLGAISRPSALRQPARPDRELLEEILEHLREQQVGLGSTTPNKTPEESATAPLRPNSTHIGHPGLAKAEEYALTRLKAGAPLSEVVSSLESRGVRRRLAEDMAKQLKREVDG